MGRTATSGPLILDQTAIRLAAFSARRPLELTPIRRLTEAESSEFSALVAQATGSHSFTPRAAMLLAQNSQGMEGMVGIGTLNGGDGRDTRVSAFKPSAGGITVAGPEDSERYAHLTDAFEDAFQVLVARECAENRERRHVGCRKDLSQIKEEIFAGLTAAKDNPISTTVSEKVTEWCATLGAALEWDVQHQDFKLLESLRALDQLHLFVDATSPAYFRMFSTSVDEVIKVLRDCNAPALQPEDCLREYNTAHHGLMVLTILRSILFRVDGAIRYDAGVSDTLSLLNTLSQDDVFNARIRVLGEDELRIIPGLSVGSAQQMYSTLTRALKQRDPSLLEPVRRLLLPPLLQAAPSQTAKAPFSDPDLRIQMVTSKDAPLRLFDSFARLNASTANPDPSAPPFLGTEIIWSGTSLSEVYLRNGGTLLTASDSQKAEPRFFYLLLPHGSQNGAEKISILDRQGIASPVVVENYAYLIVGERDFCRKMAQQGVDLYKVMNNFARTYALMEGADHLLARVRIGNLSRRAHERVDWQIQTEYQDPETPFRYGIMSCSTQVV